MDNTAVRTKPFYKKIKIDNSKIWALWGQVIFALFVIIAFYAITFAGTSTDDKSGSTLIKNILDDFNNIDGKTSDVYGLGVTGLVFVFVGIVMPAISFFYENKKLNFWLGWGVVLFDVIAFVTVTASISVFAAQNNGTTNYSTKHPGEPGEIYDAGYLAGQFIFEMLGTIIAGLGIYSSYKEDLVNKEVINSFMPTNGKSSKDNGSKKDNNKVASKKGSVVTENGDDVVIIGDEDNKSFKAQEKEINRAEKKEEKETKKDAEEVFGKPSKETKSKADLKAEKIAEKREKESEKKLAKQKKTIL